MMVCSLLSLCAERCPHWSPRSRLTTLMLVFLCLCLPARAAVKTWDGSHGASWSTSANWVGGQAPANGDDLVFPSKATNLANTNDISHLDLRSITFSGFGYNLMGNPVRLTTTDGINGDHASGTCVVQLDIGLTSKTTFSCSTPGATLRVDGAVNLGAHDLTFLAASPTSEIQAGGMISGIGNVNKDGQGVLLLDGMQSNTFKGTTRVIVGTLELNDTSVPLVDMVPGDILVEHGAVLLLTEGHQIADDAHVTVVGDGLWDLNNHSETVADLTLEVGGDVQTGSGMLALGVDATVDVVAPFGSNEVSEISGFLDVGTGTSTLNVAMGYLHLTAQVSGSADIRKTGHGGVAYLMSSNAFTGTMTAEAGNLDLSHAHALGSPGAGTYIEGTASLGLRDGIHVVGESLTMDSSGAPLVRGGSVYVGGPSNTWSGPVELRQDTLVVSFLADGHLTLDGRVSGSGSMIKIGPGTLRLAGPGDNSYTGDTLAEEGVLELAAGRVVRHGTLEVGTGDGGPATDVVRFLANSAIHVDADVVINSDGWVDLNGFNDDLGDLLFDRGRLTTGAGELWMAGDLVAVESFDTNWMGYVSGNVQLLSSMGTAMRVFDVAEDVFFELDATTSGNGGITKAGQGHLVLVRANTYTDLTVVDGGYLNVAHPEALGNTGAGTIVHAGATLRLSFNGTVTGEALELRGEGMPAYGSLDSEFDAGWAGSVALQADSTVYVDAGNRMEIDGIISGPGGLETIGGGTLAFTGSADNTFAGTTTVASGTLELGRAFETRAVPGDLVIEGTVRLAEDLQTSEATDVTVLDGGLLHCDGQWAAIDELSGDGEVRLTDPGGLEIGHRDGSSTFDGTLTGQGWAALGVALAKVGSGTFTLAGTNTYTEGTQVHQGMLVVNGYQPQSSVQVYSDASLSGTGTVGSIECRGALSPGNSPGRLYCENIELTPSADLYVELAGRYAGQGYDQLRVRGSKNIDQASLHVVPGFDSPARPGEQFSIVFGGSGSVTGSFSGLPDDAEFEVDGFNFRIAYGSGVRLILLEVPAAQSGAKVTAGNGNHLAEPDECNHLALSITNRTGVPMTDVSAHLASVTHRVMVTQPESLYPDVPAGGEALNLTPFQLATLPGADCGYPVVLDLVVETSSHGSFIVPIVLPAAGLPSPTPQRFDNPTFLAIPDVGSVESTNHVSGFSGPITKVAVSLWMTHTYVGDLTIELVSPLWSSVQLSGMNGSGANFGTGCSPDGSRTTFDDEAAVAVASGSAPFMGVYRPDEPLAGLLDSWADGDWVLRVTDAFGGSLGTLRCWSLFLYPAECEPGGGYCGTCPGEFVGQIEDTDPVQVGRLVRLGGRPSSCSRPVEAPWLGDHDLRHFDVYAFTNESPDEACISVGLLSPGNSVMAVSYVDAFDPSNVLSNYVGDSHMSTEPVTSDSISYSFLVPPGSEFFVTVHEVGTHLAYSAYTLMVSGLPCPPPELNIERAPGENVRLDWPSWAGGYLLQDATSVEPFGWNGVMEEPVISGGRFTVTNPAGPVTGFYRLKKP